MNAIHFLLSPLAVLLVVLARCDDGNEVPGRHRTPEPMAVRIDPTAHIWSDGYYAFVVSRTNGGALRFRGVSCRKREADDVSDRLTELDALNISMIRRAEEMMTNETRQH